jgi:tRNA dimethylallyltransferase
MRDIPGASALPPLLIVAGPTASGKTDVVLRAARRFPSVVINADARQIYREMDIGTGKPPGDSVAGGRLVDGVLHHLMDILSPAQPYSLKNFQDHAVPLIRAAWAEGKMPVLVGGTGLYIRAVVEGYDLSAQTDAARAAALEAMPAEERRARLLALQPDAGETVDLHNPQRVLRALLVAEATGRLPVGAARNRPLDADVRMVGIELPRQDLYARINRRVDAMMAGGLEAEVAGLYARYGGEAPGMSGIGYRELVSYIEGRTTRDRAVELIKQNTRHYAKRQLTWFRREPRMAWYAPEAIEDIVMQWIEEQLHG